MTISRVLDFQALRLEKGAHRRPDDGMCVMEATAWIAGEPHSDSPQCVSPVIGAFLRSWNDSLPDDDRQMLVPYVTRVIGTRGTPEQEKQRSSMALDWLIRMWLPAWLRAAGLNEYAEPLATAGPLTVDDDFTRIQPHLNAAASAAWLAAGAAAWEAAGAAAREAARESARSAAGAAAREAVWAAARSAALEAAWSAAGEALEPTVRELQASAFDLLDRMIAVTNEGVAAEHSAPSEPVLA